MAERRAIRLSSELALPLEVVTETVAILAKRRSGKSYTARKVAEQLLAASLQVVIVDPKGDWWGIRSSADGKQPGYPILIAGGEHADVPLEPSGGEVLARFVVEQRANLLLDLSSFRKHEVATFMGGALARQRGPGGEGFLEALYRLKAQEQYRTPMMLVIDEADAIAPQKAQDNEARMLGAAEDIVRRGGQRGIGCTLISQRSAVLNKNVLTQAQVLVALRTMSPQDLAALDAWIEVHGTPAERRVLFDTLPSLPIGDAWVWSPGWPDAQGIFSRIHVDRIETFDSGATPKVGQKLSPPKSIAEVDLQFLRTALASTIEKAKADDPLELRKRIAQLERDLHESKLVMAPEGRLLTLQRENERLQRQLLDRTVLSTDQIDQLAGVADTAERLAAEFASTADQLLACARHVLEVIQPATPTPPARHTDATRTPPRPVLRALPDAPPPPNPPSSNGTLGLGERKVLQVLAQFPEGRTSNQLAMLAGYSAKASTLGVILAKLRRLGYVERSGNPRITDSGKSVIGPVDAMPTGPDLFDWWLGHPRIGGGERKVLEVLREHYPDDLSNDELARLAGYSTTASTLGVILAKLRKLGLVESNARRLTAEFAEAIS